MSASSPPLILSPEQLEKSLGKEPWLIIDLSKPELYNASHVPGAVHLDYAQLVTARPPVMGLLPENDHLSAVFSRLGLTPDTHVVAYDDEGGGRASRLLWTLDVVGHRHLSLLDGGRQAWLAQGRPVRSGQESHPASDYHAIDHGAARADMAYIRAHLTDPAVVRVDARSPLEYSGQKRLAERGGHIPGAVNFDWITAMDLQNNLRLKPAEKLRRALTALGITQDKEVIVYCQTHHRSAHTYVVLKSLGYTKIKGYPGSWSEWGNQSDTPIE